jgi:hypothetical protein
VFTSAVATISAAMSAGGPVAGTGGMLMGAHHPGVDPDRPGRALVPIGISAQLGQDPFPGAVP